MTFTEPLNRVSAAKSCSLRSPSRRPGLTLIELVIVIAILTVLGGLVVQTLPNLLKRTHLSKCSDTISTLNRAWGESYALNTKYPDRYDSLLAADGTKFSKLTPGLSTLVTPTTLTPAELKALNSIGIRNVVDLDPAAVNVTYDSAPLGVTRRTLDGSGSVAMLSPPGSGVSTLWDANPLKLRRHLETTDTVKYLVFGIGANCTGVGAGKLMQEAPVHFRGRRHDQPEQCLSALPRDLLGHDSRRRHDGTGPLRSHGRQRHRRPIERRRPRASVLRRTSARGVMLGCAFAQHRDFVGPPFTDN